MLAILAAVAIAQSPTIQRDEYGVPHIQASSIESAFEHAGYAVAQDRLWQMEMSRRVARGQMAEVFGPSFVASDREVLSFAYTDDELRQQVDGLTPTARTAISSYVKGVNLWIDEAKTKNQLPEGYSKNAFSPQPWTELDTAAIAIRLFQQFGKGGAGEIRNMALLGYLQGRKETKDRVLDVLDDFAWFNDPEASTTIRDSDYSTRPEVSIEVREPSREAKSKHIASLPKVSLFELLPAVRLAEMQSSKAAAESVSAPFKWGSYAIAVGPDRSATGYPILLSAPQMGFRTPSVVHEMSISAPGYEAVGMDVPGVPGIAIGHTRRIAWGLTSGVADTDDIFYNPVEGGKYRQDGFLQDFQSVTFTLKAKGSPDQSFVQRRTSSGPVVLESKTAGVVFSRMSASRGRELKSLDSVFALAGVDTPENVEITTQYATVNFNLFLASIDGSIEYRYTGIVPIRSVNVDPRFPALAAKENQWQGRMSMPRIRNPRSGLLANWNNKPVRWWPNFDTPVWGKIFRDSELRACLGGTKLGVSDLERAAWTIARKDETWPFFQPYVERVWKGSALEGFDGWMLDGSSQAQAFRLFLDDLRESIFLPTTGNFVSPDNFRLVAQPSVMLKALQRKTKIDYLQGRKPEEVVREALAKSAAKLSKADAVKRYAANPIPVAGQPPIPYSNRGTYIQVVELTPSGIEGRNVVTPGVAESGPHSLDQVHLARAWMYKAMRWR